MRSRLLIAVFALVLSSGFRSATGDDLGPGLQAAAGGVTHGARASDSAVDDQRGAEASRNHIQQLIDDLGSPRYTVRRMAANELRQIGAEAFDMLNAAMDSADPEVAASADYLSRQITVRWVQSDDTASVRRILRDYGEQSEELRERNIAELARLPKNEGAAALCRIARFERSPLLAREAALCVIRPDEEGALPIEQEIIEDELGGSTRTAANWLRQYRVQLRDPAAAAAQWQPLVDEEMAVFERNSDDTSAAIVLGLLWNQADVYRQLDNRPALFGAVDKMMHLDEESIDRTSADLLIWLVQNKSWDVLDEFLQRYDETLSQAKRPLYFAALARAEQGKQELADRLAAKAAALEPLRLLESYLVARELEQENQYEWAVREYKRVIETQEGAGAQGFVGQESILARISLANLQYDHADYAGAVSALEPLVSKIQEQGNNGILYNEIRRLYMKRLGFTLPDNKSLSAKLHHYRACQFHEEGDWSREREELESAIQRDKTDADVLIQMYRLPEQDKAWKTMVAQRIRDLAREMQAQIDESPNDPTAYNQWAWLIANTEGDFQQAVRYSHKSLELLGPRASDSSQASFLDTLGRCYYAAGDLESAVKYQREAIEKLDYMQVMYRQLAQFEKELAARQGAGGEE